MINVSSSKNSKEIFCAQFFVIHNFCHRDKIKRISSPFLFQFSVLKISSKGIETWKDVTCLKSIPNSRGRLTASPKRCNDLLCKSVFDTTFQHCPDRTVSNGPSSRTLSPSIYLRLSSDIYWIGTRGSIGYNASGRAKSVRFTVRSPLSLTSLDRPVDWHRSMT